MTPLAYRCRSKSFKIRQPWYTWRAAELHSGASSQLTPTLPIPTENPLTSRNIGETTIASSPTLRGSLACSVHGPSSPRPPSACATTPPAQAAPASRATTPPYSRHAQAARLARSVAAPPLPTPAWSTRCLRPSSCALSALRTLTTTYLSLLFAHISTPRITQNPHLTMTERARHLRNASGAPAPRALHVAVPTASPSHSSVFKALDGGRAFA